MTLHDVLNCPTRICGHAFILAMMLSYGPAFTVNDLNRGKTEMTQANLFPITIVNTRTFAGDSEYIGRPMKDRPGSPLGNPFKVKPHGPYERNESVFRLYRQWLWKEMQDTEGKVFKELLRLKSIAETRPLNLACWCAPQACHGDVVKKAIEYLSATRAV